MGKRGSSRSYLFIRSRKAVSPLIATMFLILFAISLGAIVMFAGTAISDREFCKGIYLEAETVCDGGGYINFAITNQGGIDIANLQVSAIGDKNVHIWSVGEISPNIKSTISRKDNSLTYSLESVGLVREVTFTPYIRLGNDIKQCTANRLRVNTIERCNK
jgi:hypothetical protein